jgi:hypothetical protein
MNYFKHIISSLHDGFNVEEAVAKAKHRQATTSEEKAKATKDWPLVENPWAVPSEVKKYATPLGSAVIAASKIIKNWAANAVGGAS